MLVAENIGVIDFFHIAAEFHFLRRGKINKVFSDYLLGYLVPSRCGHCICHNASVACNGDIGSTRSDIDQSDVYKTYFGRDNYVHGGNRLQRKA